MVFAVVELLLTLKPSICDVLRSLHPEEDETTDTVVIRKKTSLEDHVFNFAVGPEAQTAIIQKAIENWTINGSALAPKFVSVINVCPAPRQLK